MCVCVCVCVCGVVCIILSLSNGSTASSLVYFWFLTGFKWDIVSILVMSALLSVFHACMMIC